MSAHEGGPGNNGPGPGGAGDGSLLGLGGMMLSLPPASTPGNTSYAGGGSWIDGMPGSFRFGVDAVPRRTGRRRGKDSKSGGGGIAFVPHRRDWAVMESQRCTFAIAFGALL